MHGPFNLFLPIVFCRKENIVEKNHSCCQGRISWSATDMIINCSKYCFSQNDDDNDRATREYYALGQRAQYQCKYGKATPPQIHDPEAELGESSGPGDAAAGCAESATRIHARNDFSCRTLV